MNNDLDYSLLVELTRLGMGDKEPVETLEILASMGFSDREIWELVIKYSALESPDGGAKLIYHYSELGTRWKDMYPPESINQRIVCSVRRRISKTQRISCSDIYEIWTPLPDNNEAAKVLFALLNETVS